MRSTRTAFTLVELLVVIAIIGILVALLLPAVQAAREASRRASCSNNLKQIGVALHNYHDTQRRLPPGWMAYDPANGQPHWFGVPGWGWAARTLPYLEQTAVYDNMVRLDLPITDPANAAARTVEIKTFRCPSDIGGPTFVLQGGGPLVGSGSFTPVALSTGNYIGSFGTVDFHLVCVPPNSCEGNGTFFLERGVNFSEILDGLSQTFVVGERSSRLAPSTWVGVVTGGEHAPARICGVASYPPNSTATATQYMHNFSSQHPAGTNFLAADGSVRLVAESIAEEVYHALCTRAAGEVVGSY